MTAVPEGATRTPPGQPEPAPCPGPHHPQHRRHPVTLHLCPPRPLPNELPTQTLYSWDAFLPRPKMIIRNKKTNIIAQT